MPVITITFPIGHFLRPYRKLYTVTVTDRHSYVKILALWALSGHWPETIVFRFLRQNRPAITIGKWWGYRFRQNAAIPHGTRLSCQVWRSREVISVTFLIGHFLSPIEKFIQRPTPTSTIFTEALMPWAFFGHWPETIVFKFLRQNQFFISIGK